MRHVGDITDNRDPNGRALIPQTGFQVTHRHLLMLIEDAAQELPERQWESLRAILLRRLGVNPDRPGEANPSA